MSDNTQLTNLIVYSFLLMEGFTGHNLTIYIYSNENFMKAISYLLPETREKLQLTDPKYLIFEVIFERNLCALMEIIIGWNVINKGVDGVGTGNFICEINSWKKIAKAFISLIVWSNCVFQNESHSQEHKIQSQSHRSQIKISKF